MKPFDPQLIALTGSINQHVARTYRTQENRARNQEELRLSFQEALKFPILEISPKVWDDLSEAAETAMFI